MNMTDFDPIWEQKYNAGHQQRAPWDLVVSFIYRHRPENRQPNDISILEVGCGTAGNLWFASLEGFAVSGLDASPSAIEAGRKRFQKFGLEGDLRVGNFKSLPFEDNAFDLIIDRAALTCVGKSVQELAIAEIYRCLRPGGKFLFTPYASTHSSYLNGTAGPDGVTVNIRKGSVSGAGQIRFMDQQDIRHLLDAGKWTILEMRYHSEEDVLGTDKSVHTYWKVVAAKS